MRLISQPLREPLTWMRSISSKSSGKVRRSYLVPCSYVFLSLAFCATSVCSVNTNDHNHCHFPPPLHFFQLQGVSGRFFLCVTRRTKPCTPLRSVRTPCALFFSPSSHLISCHLSDCYNLLYLCHVSVVCVIVFFSNATHCCIESIDTILSLSLDLR